MRNIFQAKLAMIVVSLFLQQSSLMAELEEIVIRKPILYELSSRDEMVHLAGYGEEKLSTVLVTGSVLCEARQLHSQSQPQLRSWPISVSWVALDPKLRHGLIVSVVQVALLLWYPIPLGFQQLQYQTNLGLKKFGRQRNTIGWEVTTILS
ncbi:acyl carrier protein 3 [Hibiscus syriacus]|uniref:Acyl carrier protein 3 n=1 Tax=Hibiscus syriacus TaxID=106335 RepID=A0A6A3BK06_HIBSY|nr:acyl carrier protein 3 [Hibiscus syriacus]